MRRGSRRGTSISPSTSPRTCSRHPGDPGARTHAPSTSTRLTRSRTPAGSPIASSRARCRRKRPCAGRSSARGRRPESGRSSGPSRRALRRASRCATRRETCGSCRSTPRAFPKRRPAPSSSPTRSSGRSATGRSRTSRQRPAGSARHRASPRRCGRRPARIGRCGSATSKTCCGERTGAPDGTYRAIAARAVPGRPLGGFRYYGTRPDDPERRRPARTPARTARAEGVRRMDESHGHEGGQYARHAGDRGRSRHGSPLSAGRRIDVWHRRQRARTTTTRDGKRSSTASLVLKRLYTVGFFLQPWQTTSYVKNPAIGRFEGKDFDPPAWTPRVPTAAFLRARDDDTFWAARRVMAFSDEDDPRGRQDRTVQRSAAEQLLGGRVDRATRHDRSTPI